MEVFQNVLELSTERMDLKVVRYDEWIELGFYMGFNSCAMYYILSSVVQFIAYDLARTRLMQMATTEWL